MIDEKRNALLVVAALLVTVTYQAAITPPGGLWQDDWFESNTTAPHIAGSAIAWGTSPSPFLMFLIFNSMIFLSSIAAMIVLVPVPGGIVGVLLAAVSMCLYFCYFNSLMIITQAPDWFFNAFYSPFIIFTVIIIAREGLGYLPNLIWKELKRIYSRAWSYCI